MTTLYEDVRINGVFYGGFSSGISFAPLLINAVSFGSVFNSGHFKIRNILVSDTAWGNGNLFAPVLNDLSEFDGLVGDDGSITASGGVLTVDDPTSGNDHYGWKSIAGLTTIYVSMELAVYDDDNGGDYTDFFNDTPADQSNEVDGIFYSFFGSQWRFEWSGARFGTGPSFGAIYDLVEIRYSYDSPLPPPAPNTHICS